VLFTRNANPPNVRPALIPDAENVPKLVVFSTPVVPVPAGKPSETQLGTTNVNADCGAMQV
jgi:hypothetical protein